MTSSSFIQRQIYLSPYVFPAYFLRFEIADIPFTALEFFTYLLFGLWYSERIRDHQRFIWTPAFRRYTYAGLLFLIGASIGVLIAPEFTTLPDGDLIDTQRIALGVWKSWIIAPFLYFIVLSQVLKTPREVEKLLQQFINSAVVLSLLAYGFGLWGHGFTFDYRLRGFFESANHLALYIGPALMLNFYQLFHLKGLGKHAIRYTLGTFVVLLYTLLMTQSYAAILGAFGATGLWLFYTWWSRSHLRARLKPALMILLLLLLVVLASQISTPKFKNFLNFKERSSTSVRLEIYRTAGYLLGQHPLSGIGLGQFQPQYQNAAIQVLGQAPLEWNMPHPHNLFLAHWLNAGLLGLLSLLLLITLAHRYFTYPLIALWQLVLHGLFDTPFWKNDLVMIFWLLIAAIYLLQTHANHSPKNPAN